MVEPKKENVAFAAGEWVRELKRIEWMGKEITKALEFTVPSPQVIDFIRRSEMAKEELARTVDRMKEHQKAWQKLFKNVESLAGKLQPKVK